MGYVGIKTCYIVCFRRSLVAFIVTYNIIMSPVKRLKATLIIQISKPDLVTSQNETKISFREYNCMQRFKI
jgi:hypothetical protein